MLAHVYIFYGFESAGDIAEETKDAGRQIPHAMRWRSSSEGSPLRPVAALLLAIPAGARDHDRRVVRRGGPVHPRGDLPPWMQDLLTLLVIFAFFSCGTSVQGAGSRLAFSYARDRALPGAGWISRVHARFQTPVNALLAGAAVTVLFTLLVNLTPTKDVHIGFITYPANVNALVALVSFGVSGIYLSFFLTVIGAIIARSRGWIPEGAFRLGRWGLPVCIIGAVYLGLMLLDVVARPG